MESSYEQVKPSRMQLLQTSRCPSQRTLRARQVTHVLEGFFDGLEVIMDHECEGGYRQ
jgi:hypothetical protein